MNDSSGDDTSYSEPQRGDTSGEVEAQGYGGERPPEAAAPRRRLGMPGRPRPGEYLETVFRDPDPDPDPAFVPDPDPAFDPDPDPAFVPDRDPAFVPDRDPAFVPDPDPAFDPDPPADASASAFPLPGPALPDPLAAAPASVPEPRQLPRTDPEPAARLAPAPVLPAPEPAPALEPPATVPAPASERRAPEPEPEAERPAPGPAPASERSAAEPDAVAQVPLKAALEAILMIVDEPATVAHLAEVLARPKRAVSAALRELAGEYTAQGRGFDLRFVAGGWRFYSRASCAPAVDRYVLDGQHARLTQAALETLAVIAYRQPVSRSRVSAVRGVNCDGVMRTLVQRGLVEETGSEPETGAILYRTTQQFLERMGLRGLDELPELAPFLPEADEVEPDSQEGSAIAEAVAVQS